MVNRLLLPLVILGCFSQFASAAVTFTGSYSSNLKQADGTTNITTGTRYIVVVDTGGDGFGGSSTMSVASGTSLVTGSSFGGDEIIQSSTVGALAGRASTGVSNLGLDVAPYAGKDFALYWFDSFTGTTVTDGLIYGFYRDSGWDLPVAAGTYGFASSGGDYIQNTSSLTPSLTIGSVPEPSRVLLLALGGMGLIMRRRRA